MKALPKKKNAIPMPRWVFTISWSVVNNPEAFWINIAALSANPFFARRVVWEEIFWKSFPYVFMRRIQAPAEINEKPKINRAIAVYSWIWSGEIGGMA